MAAASEMLPQTWLPKHITAHYPCLTLCLPGLFLDLYSTMAILDFGPGPLLCMTPFLIWPIVYYDSGGSDAATELAP